MHAWGQPKGHPSSHLSVASSCCPLALMLSVVLDADLLRRLCHLLRGVVGPLRTGIRPAAKSMRCSNVPYATERQMGLTQVLKTSAKSCT